MIWKFYDIILREITRIVKYNNFQITCKLSDLEGLFVIFKDSVDFKHFRIIRGDVSALIYSIIVHGLVPFGRSLNPHFRLPFLDKTHNLLSFQFTSSLLSKL